MTNEKKARMWIEFIVVGKALGVTEREIEDCEEKLADVLIEMHGAKDIEFDSLMQQVIDGGMDVVHEIVATECWH